MIIIIIITIVITIIYTRAIIIIAMTRMGKYTPWECNQ